MKISHLIINGHREESPVAEGLSEDILELKSSFIIDRSFRSSSEKQEVPVTEDDVIELTFEDQTTWICNPESLGELFPETLTINRSANGGLEMPLSISGQQTERGAGEVFLKIIKIFSRKKIKVEIKKLAEEAERKQLNNKSGLYRLDSNFELLPFSIGSGHQQYCVFIHGTGSSTAGSFASLKSHVLWKELQATFGNNLLAFQHETLTKSPLQNALELINALPASCSLTFITHSRGGLVGDVVARFATENEKARGFSKEEKEVFNKAGRSTELNLIKQLEEAVAGKKITVSNFIRTACPASGTTLASGRLDNTLNMLLNLIGLVAGIMANVAFLAFKTLVAEVVKSKSDPETLPGLEAMDPGSPFIKALNFVASPIEVSSPLVVIAGNCKMKPNLKALVIIASKLFYKRQNDLVVDSNAMYMGARRATFIQYYFDEGTSVDHFNYFQNPQTQNAISRALNTQPGLPIPDFKQRSQLSDSATERHALIGLDGGEVFKNTVTGSRPIVVLLPGIMGSSLQHQKERIWINYLRFAFGELKRLELKNKDINPAALIKTSYNNLVKDLGSDYDVVTYPFDWRLPLGDTAGLLNKKITELMAYRQPIKLIGHSMGGVLIRDFIVRYRDTWEALNNTPEFTLLFLGSPLGGSYRIPYVLFGKDAIISKLSKLDILHDKKDLLKIFSSFPGLLNLLPVSGKHDFSDPALWKEMQDANGDKTWPLPPAQALKDFAEYKALANGLKTEDFKNAVYIAGQDSATPCDFRIEETSNGKSLVFLSTAEGDQSVTWDSGIPSEMTDRQLVYFAKVSHGSLANDKSIFPAIRDILEKRSTQKLTTQRPVFRSGQKIFVAPELNDLDFSPEGLEATLLGIKESKEEQVIEIPLTAVVANGDLRYASYPVMAGHFLNDGILYAERAIDKNLNYALTEQHAMGIYPGETGTCEIIVASEQGFKGGVIIGLGAPGELTAHALTESVSKGVLKYLLDLNNGKLAQCGITNTSEKIGISSLIIGCGFGGLTIESSVRAILQGIIFANDKIRRSKNKNYRLIEVVEFVEQYEDRARACFYIINKITYNERLQLNVIADKEKIKPLLGSKKRLPADDYEEWWLRIAVSYNRSENDKCEAGNISFSAATGGAREEFRQVFSSSALLEQLMDDISVKNQWRPELAKSIFELLIPNDFKNRFQRSFKINWILDKKTAEYPWELLQESTTDDKPLCINAGMIRQLKTPDSRVRITMVADNTALVIGDPELNNFLSQLPGAKEEAGMVNKLLESQGYESTALINRSAPEIIEKLFSKDYKIIHLSGHGIFNKECPVNSGMVIGKNLFLTTAQIAQMANTPELVFVNCCYLGKTDNVAEEFFRSRYKLAANIGTQLIENGVKAVVVAAWAVEDMAALDFTKIFYQKMFEGTPFGDAVHAARKYVYTHHKNANNTWGAYQCYGDPFYRFRPTFSKSKEYKYDFVVEEEAEVELFNLRNYVQTGNYDHDEVISQMMAIESSTLQNGLLTARITELEALIYADLYEYDKALAKMDELMKMEDARYDVSTLERYINIRAKNFVLTYLRTNRKNRAQYRQKIKALIEEINMLFAISPTSERYILRASTTKRKSLLESSKEEMLASLAEAAYNYMKAYSYKNSVNSLGNWYQLETILNLAGVHAWGDEISDYESSYRLPQLDIIKSEIKEEIEKIKQEEHNNYWMMAKKVNLKLILFLLNASEGTQVTVNEILSEYKSLWNRAGSKGSKFSEIEHIDIIIHAMDLINTTVSKKISKELNLLRKELLALLIK